MDNFSHVMVGHSSNSDTVRQVALKVCRVKPYS